MVYGLAIMALTACSLKNPFDKDWKTPYGTAPFSSFSEADYLPAIREGIARRKAEVQAIIDNPAEPDFDNTIVPYELGLLQPRRI